MIEVDGLTKRYGDRVAVNNVSFRVDQGEILGFLGPNGAGKTTTMRMLTGYIPASAGSATIAGHDIFSDSLEARRNIGYLPEGVPLYPEMSVASYLDHMARLRRVPQRRVAVERAMGLVHMEDRANDRIAKLSKGQRQRVGLAQALIHDPPVLILDEPTVGLDPRQIIEVRELIRELGGKRTVILSTHILPEVSQLCGRVIILKNGEIAAIDTPQGLTERLQGTERIFLQVARPESAIPPTIGDIPGVVGVVPQSPESFEVQCAPEHDIRQELAELVVQRGWGLLEMRPVGMSLEQVFLELTTQEDASEVAVMEESA
jgi:ABC-2 type transport system ATP-binding protein